MLARFATPSTVGFVPIFSDEVVSAVLAHMNGDHPDDNLLIARAFGERAATAARMTGLDEHGGHWSCVVDAVELELTVPWPSGEISTRPQIRHEIVALYDEACRRLGVEPRPH